MRNRIVCGSSFRGAANLRDKIDRFFSSPIDNEPKRNVINQLPADSALVEIKQCIKVFEASVYLCNVLNYTSAPIGERVAVIPLKGNGKEGQRALIRSPRLLDSVPEYLDMPLVLVQKMEEVKRGTEYEIKIS